MKTAVIPNLTRKNAHNVTVSLCKKLKNLGITYMLDESLKGEMAEVDADFLPFERMIDECDIIIPVGGDGTILHAAKFGKPVLGINAGRIAFMAGLEPTELDLLTHLKDGSYKTDKRMMLTAAVNDGKKEIACSHCINDVVAARGEQIKMVEISVECDDRPINDYFTDGIIISTPTGSTAYNLSAGGPVVDPEIESLLLTPVCTHSLFSRTLIFKPDVKLVLKALSEEGMRVSCDGGEPINIPCGGYITVERAPMDAEFIRIKADAFHDILNNKLAQRRL
ncbi:MAG: NAD(+)/NADH kinase [Clostridia bacterium]|nr:NAD(+)/NADH kinase [Clostridia bacterium]